MTTLAKVRQDVAVNLHDILQLTATADDGTNGVYDTVNLVEADDWYAGCDLVCVSTADPTSPNAWFRGYVTGSSEAIGAVTIKGAFPSATKAGDRFQLVNLDRLGGSLSDYDLWIAAAVNKAREERASVRLEKPVGTWSDAAQSLGPRVIAVPSELKVVHSLTYLDAQGVRWYPERGSRAQNAGWWVDAVNRVVRIDPCLSLDMDGSKVTLVGFGPPQELAADESETSISHEFLVAQASLIAARSLQRKGRADLNQFVPLWSQEAQEAKAQLRPGSWPSGSVAVW